MLYVSYKVISKIYEQNIEDMSMLQCFYMVVLKIKKH